MRKDSKFLVFIKPFLNWKFLISFGLAWLVMNGWSLVFVVSGVAWMIAAGSVWLGILAMPNGVGVIVSMPLALALQMLLFKGDEKLRGDIFKMKWEAERKSVRRFLTAQNGVISADINGVSVNTVYEAALAEIKNGKKVGDWMDFVFPSVRGTGESESDYFSLRGDREAKRYYRNKTLRKRLYEAIWAVKEQNVVSVFGLIDAEKFYSCLEIFEKVAGGKEWKKNFLN